MGTADTPPRPQAVRGLLLSSGNPAASSGSRGMLFSASHDGGGFWAQAAERLQPRRVAVAGLPRQDSAAALCTVPAPRGRLKYWAAGCGILKGTRWRALAQALSDAQDLHGPPRTEDG